MKVESIICVTVSGRQKVELKLLLFGFVSACKKCHSGEKIKVDETGEASSIYGEQKCTQDFVEKPTRKRPLSRPRCG
jgi:hypothetical protein